MSTATTPTAQRPIVCPFTVAIDTREQLPYSFTGLQADASQKNRPLEIPTKVTTIYQGDYSIIGMESRVSIERKSLSDLYGSLGKNGRDRFEREHERLASYEFAVVVIESSYDNALSNPPSYSKLDPKSISRTSFSWPMRYGVHWRFVGIDRQKAVQAITQYGLETVAAWCEIAFFRQESHANRVEKVIEAYRAQQSRLMAQAATFRYLELFWKHSKEKDKEANERNQPNTNSTGRGKRIGTDGQFDGYPAPTGTARGPRLGQPGHDPTRWTPSGKPIDDIPF